MSSLEPTDDEEPTDDADETTVTVTAGDRELDVSLPDDASSSEAAAIASAISAHVTDRQRAAAAAAAARDDGPEYANEWVLEGRLERFGKRRRPQRVEKGDEWKAAGRSFYR
ncbi:MULTISPECIES: hypothetical protein [Halomicrobium]|uniref:Acc operon protein n=2 Tax=Halomicrobium mukohataei TaxID=57705 RepID=C7NXG0_HALMD|nr:MULTISPECIES: hypothetical protein [Halomicrobium]ACV48394.1 conserved hypothetical protein [Halomicrobium mukohataei DSM 12286]QCD66804.1 hypothetical protein E5139_14550 [Halomicrobium mukohataei]QFR21613.1 hypothetical protein GBQ70_14565 [Halomicrobium sp. ZPS1]